MSFAKLLKERPTADKIVLNGGQSQGYVEKPKNKISLNRYTPSLQKGNEYAKVFKEESDNAYYQEMLAKMRDLSGKSEVRPDLTDPGGSEQTPGNSQLFELDELTSIGTTSNVRELTREELTQVYQQFNFKPLEPTENLRPIFNESEQILARIETNSVCIIKGPTGCGKSTQIPQFVLDHYVNKSAHCNIIVTQPRRLAAITIAKHVCEQRHWKVGDLVGYQVGLDKCASENTRLLYCTTGVLLEKLIAYKTLNDYTHIFLDEVHEREEDMDFAMLVIKDFLRSNSPNVKVILMSATMNVSRFSKYFETLLFNKQLYQAPTYEIKRDSKFNVSVSYLNELGVKDLANIEHEYDKDEPTIPDASFNIVTTMINCFNRIDDEDFDKGRCRMKRPAVLIFLPGLYQIEVLFSILVKYEKEYPGATKLWLCPLHSSITKDEQEKVQKFSPLNQRKVILSTNIAESSLTIPDVKYVIDFCLTKHIVSDPITGFSSLKLAWASKTNCTQREGRAGRVMDGRVYRMVPKKFYQLMMPEEGVPEMTRCPLDIIVLKCKKLFEDKVPLRLISTALDPPDLTNYEKTILKLKEIGALLPLCRGVLDPLDGDITFVGKVMGSLPLDIKITKLILLGHVYDVLEESIIMGCAMAVRNIFSEPFNKRLVAYTNKLLWADTSQSDSIAYLNAYLVWREYTGIGRFQRSVGDEFKWGEKYMLQIKSLREMVALEDDIKRRLSHFSIQVVRKQNKPQWTAEQKPLILKLVLAGAFYPHYYSRKPQNADIETEAVKTLAGYNPLSCVYLQNMPHPAPKYYDQVERQLRTNGVSTDVTFHCNDTRKLIVEFNLDTTVQREKHGDKEFYGEIPGDIRMPVYRAVKLRQLNQTITVKTANPNNQKELCEETSDLSLETKSVGTTYTTSSQPLIGEREHYLEVEITEVVNAGHFYCHLNLETTKHRLKKVLEILNLKDALGTVSGGVKKEMIYAAPYTDDDGSVLFFRAKVKNIFKDPKGFVIVEVFFIDYGNSSQMSQTDLREVVNEDDQETLSQIPPLALECVLAEVSPSVWTSRDGFWSREATEYVHKLLTEPRLMLRSGGTAYCAPVWMIDVYSFVNNVASVILYLRDNTGPSDSEPLTLNKELVNRGFARHRDESVLSKLNHDRRKLMRGERSESSTYGDISSVSQLERTVDPFSFPSTISYRPVTLKGPVSPLEMKLFSLAHCSTHKEVKVEWNSVNSVLLDGNASDPHERILVAGSVTQSPDRQKLTLNHTTVLPNMEGLAALISLIFAPTVELRTDENFSRFTGALCGLGKDEEGRSIYPENDMEIVFDVEFTKEDLIDVNKLRFWINDRYSGDDSEEMAESSILKDLNNIRDITFRLLSRNRPSIKVTYNPHPHEWGLIPIDQCLAPLDTNFDEFNSRKIYKLHYAPNINPENDLIEVKDLIYKLEAVNEYIASRLIPPKGHMFCALCDIHFDYWKKLCEHVTDNQHHKELLKWLSARARAHKLPFNLLQ